MEAAVLGSGGDEVVQKIIIIIGRYTENGVQIFNIAIQHLF